MKVFYVVVITATLSFTSAIDNAVTPFLANLNAQLPVPVIGGPDALQIGQLSLFWQYVYHLTTSSGIFHKVFDVSLKNPTEIAAALLFNSMYYSSHLSATYGGTLPQEISQAAEKAFIRGLTPLSYSKPFINGMEDYLWKMGIMNPTNILSIAQKYHSELEKALEALGPLDSALAHLYALTVADTNFMSTFGPITPENMVNGTKNFLDAWNKV